jgi:hypothetical protein
MSTAEVPRVDAKPVEEPARPLDHPARPDDRDRGKVAMGYEGYRMPVWVILPWLAFIVYAVTYMFLYLLPGPANR